MAIERHVYLDTPASRHVVRDALVNADIGSEAKPNLKKLNGALSGVMDVVIPSDLSGSVVRPNNGVIAKCRVMFRGRKACLSRPEFEGPVRSGDCPRRCGAVQGGPGGGRPMMRSCP